MIILPPKTATQPAPKPTVQLEAEVIELLEPLMQAGGYSKRDRSLVVNRILLDALQNATVETVEGEE